MKFLFDLFPVILFFAVFSWQKDMFLATQAAIGATVLQVLWSKWKHGQVDKMLWINLAVISIMGGATLLFHDKRFIMWKPTVLYWLFSSVLLGYRLWSGKTLVEKMMGTQVTLPSSVWLQLNWAWVGFFAGMGVLNLYIAYSFSEAIWVNFKLFGGLGLLIVFVLGQGFFLSRYMEPEKKA